MCGLRVLVVDDDRDTADSLGLLLRQLGHETSVHYDGHSVIQAIAPFDPHALMVDLAMPRLEGCKLLGRLRTARLLNGAMAVAISGYADHSHRRLAINAGFVEFLIKPCSVSEIQEVLAIVHRGGDDARAPEPSVEIGKSYAVRWAGEQFRVRVRGRGIVRPNSWVCSRLDKNKPVVLPAEAFRSLAE
jgi:CheY-like chemotaxis protein